jgi:Flp pilus assembly protein CpaB
MCLSKLQYLRIKSQSLKEINNMVSTEFALKIKAFIEHNNIDWENTPTTEIVAGYFKAQNDAIELAAQQVLTTLEPELPKLD